MELLITAYGHPNIRAEHKSTWQLTVEDEISIRADCIIGVRSSYSCASLPLSIKEAIMNGLTFSVILSVEDLSYEGYFKGSADLLLTDPLDIVIRKSDFHSSRTAGILASFSARDIPEKMKIALKDPETKLQILLKVIE